MWLFSWIWKCQEQFDKIQILILQERLFKQALWKMNKFKNSFKFSNNDIKKFIFLLRKCLYPFDYMDDWEKFNETTLPEKEGFCSNLNMEEITDADYMHRFCKDFEIKQFSWISWFLS